MEGPGMWLWAEESSCGNQLSGRGISLSSCLVTHAVPRGTLSLHRLVQDGVHPCDCSGLLLYLAHLFMNEVLVRRSPGMGGACQTLFQIQDAGASSRKALDSRGLHKVGVSTTEKLRQRAWEKESQGVSSISA